MTVQEEEGQALPHAVAQALLAAMEAADHGLDCDGSRGDGESGDEPQVPRATILRNSENSVPETKPSVVYSFGIATRGGKVSGTEVMDIPEGLLTALDAWLASPEAPIQRALLHSTKEEADTSNLSQAPLTITPALHPPNHAEHHPLALARFNAIQVEVFPPNHWFAPRAEPKEVCGPVIYCVLRGHATLCVGHGSPKVFRPSGKGVFVGAEQQLSLDQGHFVVFANDANPQFAGRSSATLSNCSSTDPPRKGYTTLQQQQQRQQEGSRAEGHRIALMRVGNAQPCHVSTSRSHRSRHSSGSSNLVSRLEKQKRTDPDAAADGDDDDDDDDGNACDDDESDPVTQKGDDHEHGSLEGDCGSREGASSSPLILASLRHVSPLPSSLIARHTERVRKQLTAVVPLAVSCSHSLEQTLDKTGLPNNSSKTTVAEHEDEPVHGDLDSLAMKVSALQAQDRAVAIEPELERLFVTNVYDTIAVHWDRTRHKPWPRVVDFLNSLAPGSLVADVGCGNGKYLGVRSDIVMVGSDRSANLCDVAASHGHEVALCDGLLLPYRGSVFDAVISVAVLHHFSTEERRARALVQMANLLRPGGQLLVQAWALEQEEDSKRSFPAQDVLVPWQHLQADQEIADGNRIAPTEQALSIGHTDNNHVYQRYCHVYREGELDAMVEATGLQVIDSYFDRSNWCVVAQKPPQHNLEEP